MKKRLCMRFDVALMRRLETARASNSGPVSNRTDWIEQACYEKILKTEEALRAKQ